MTRVSKEAGRPQEVKLNNLRNLFRKVLTAASKVARNNARSRLLKNISGLSVNDVAAIIPADLVGDAVLTSIISAKSNVVRKLHLNRIVQGQTQPSNLKAAKIVLELFASVKWKHQSLAKQALETLFPKEPVPTPTPPPSPAPPAPTPIPVPKPLIETVEPPVQVAKVVMLYGSEQVPSPKKLPTPEELHARFLELFEKLAGELCDPDADIGDKIISLMKQNDEIAQQNRPDALTSANVALHKYRKIFNKLEPAVKGLLDEPDNILLSGMTVVKIRMVTDKLEAACEVLEEWKTSHSDPEFRKSLDSLINLRILENLLKQFPEGLVSEQVEERQPGATVTPLPVKAPAPQQTFIELARELLLSKNELTDEAVERLQNLLLEEFNLKDDTLAKSQFRTAKRQANSFSEFFNILFDNFETISFSNKVYADVSLKILEIINPSEDVPDAKS